MKRFWKTAAAAPAGDHWRVELDGRPLRTQGGRPQLVPTRALAEALAAEWDAQGEEVDSATFPYRDMADYAIDMVAADPAVAIDAILPYAETDTLCYRGEPGEALTRRQLAEWEPLLAAAESRHGLRFTRVSGIVHQPQPPETLARLRELIAALGPFELAALQNTTALAASLTLGLAALDPQADLTHLWNAANLEEDWQAEIWGQDAEAATRRERRREAFVRAARFAGLARAG